MILTLSDKQEEEGSRSRGVVCLLLPVYTQSSKN